MKRIVEIDAEIEEFKDKRIIWLIMHRKKSYDYIL